METHMVCVAIYGVIPIIFTLLGWLGQVITAIWPTMATKLGLTEKEADVHPAFYADVQGEAFWDLAIYGPCRWRVYFSW
jgi:hypothetical protein